MSGADRSDCFVWSDQSEAKALALFDDDMGFEDIAIELGCSASAAKARVEMLRRRRRVSSQRGTRGNQYDRVKPEQLMSRTARSDARNRRTQTEEFFGDPPPGFSALDGMVGMTHNKPQPNQNAGRREGVRGWR